MTDPEMTEADRQAREQAAKQRFIALSLFRLSGIVILVFGFLIMLQQFGFVSGQKAKIMGAIIASAGMFQTIIVPRLLSRAWQTPIDEAFLQGGRSRRAGGRPWHCARWTTGAHPGARAAGPAA